ITGATTRPGSPDHVAGCKRVADDALVLADEPAARLARADCDQPARAGEADGAVAVRRGQSVAANLALVLPDQAARICDRAIGRAVLAACHRRGHVASGVRVPDDGKWRVVADETAKRDAAGRAADVAARPGIGDARAREPDRRAVGVEVGVLIGAD